MQKLGKTAEISSEKTVNMCVSVPKSVQQRIDNAVILLGFRSRSEFVTYILRSWLEEKGFFALPRPQLSPPAGVDAEQRGLKPGDVPGPSSEEGEGGGG